MFLKTQRSESTESNESASICETVIDEHFRRSLGADYLALFAKTVDDKQTQLSTTTAAASGTLKATADVDNYQPTPLKLTTKNDDNIENMSSLKSQLIPTNLSSTANVDSLTNANIQKPLTSTSSAGIGKTKTPQVIVYHGEGDNMLSRQLNKVQSQSQTQSSTGLIESNNSQTTNMFMRLPLQKDTNTQLRSSMLHVMAAHLSSAALYGNSITDTPTTLTTTTTSSSNAIATTTSTNCTTNNSNAKDIEMSKTDFKKSSSNETFTTATTISTNNIPVEAVVTALHLPLPLTTTILSSMSPTASSSLPSSATSVSSAKTIEAQNKTSITSVSSSSSSSSSTNNNSSTTDSDVLASIDDHFAKALGDKWKELQQNKNISK